MNQTMKSTLFWTPRVISILFILFISIFAADVFGRGFGLWETLVALFMHLIPTFALLAALILAWRQEWLGAILYIGFGGWYIIEMWGAFDWTTYVVMAGIPLLVGVLFGVGWFYRKEIRSA